MKKKLIAKVMACGIAVSMLWNPVAVCAEENNEGGEEAEYITEESYVEDFEDQEYVEVSDWEVIAEQDAEAFEESIGMTDEEVLELYNEYVENNSGSTSRFRKRSFMASEAADSERLLNGFVEDAAAKGIIKNNAVQKLALSKAVIRTQFKLVAKAAKGLGWETASAMLDHSLQNKPSNLAFSSDSKFAKQIAESAECDAIVEEFKEQVEGLDISEKSIKSSTTLNSTTDLHLSYNKVSYEVVGKKVDGKWNLKITFYDRYDFETQAWEDSISIGSIVKILNNYAAYAQEVGAIVPYDIKVTVEKSF